MNSPNSLSQIASNNAQINQGLRQTILPLTTMNFAVGAGTGAPPLLQVQLLQAGLLSRIRIKHTAVVTTGGTGTYTRAGAGLTTKPAPFGFIQNILIQSGQGNQIHSVSGWMSYCRLRTRYMGFDPMNPMTIFGGANSSPFSIPASFTTSTAYTFTWFDEIDIAWQQSVQAGLVDLQDQTNRITCQITPNTAAQLITAAGGGSVTLTSYSAQLDCEAFFITNPQNALPPLGLAHVVQEDSSNVLNAGTNTYYPQFGPLYLSLTKTYWNNSAQMVPANFSQLQMIWQGLTTAYTQFPNDILVDQELKYGAPMPDGVFVNDLSYGIGIPELRNTRDSIDSYNMTDFRVLTLLASGVSLTTGYYDVGKESLVSRS